MSEVEQNSWWTNVGAGLVFIIESPLSDKAGYYIGPIDFAGRMIEG